MHGLGNDFVMVDGFEEHLDESTLSQRATEWCDRHFGIGADGLILILPSRIAHFRMRVFNPDGSEAEASGNGIRCFAKYVYEHRKTTDTALTIETLGGIKSVQLTTRGGKVESARADIGVPDFARKAIPMPDPVLLAVLAIDRVGPAAVRACASGVEVRVAAPDEATARVLRQALAQTARRRDTDRLIRIVVD